MPKKRRLFQKERETQGSSLRRKKRTKKQLSRRKTKRTPNPEHPERDQREPRKTEKGDLRNKHNPMMDSQWYKIGSLHLPNPNKEDLELKKNDLPYSNLNY